MRYSYFDYHTIFRVCCEANTHTSHKFSAFLATVHTVAIMALEASPSEPSNNEMVSEKTFHTPNRLRKEPFSHKSDNV